MKPQQKNYYIFLGLVFGTLLGSALGFVMCNMTLCPVFGLFIGVGIGVVLEKKYNKKPLEGERDLLTDKLRILSLILGVLVLLMSLVFLVYFLKNQS